MRALNPKHTLSCCWFYACAVFSVTSDLIHTHTRHTLNTCATRSLVGDAFDLSAAAHRWSKSVVNYRADRHRVQHLLYYALRSRWAHLQTKRKRRGKTGLCWSARAVEIESHRILLRAEYLGQSVCVRVHTTDSKAKRIR